MKKIFFILLSFFFISFVNGQQFKALLVTKTAGFHHESIVDAIPAMKKLATLHFFQLDVFQNRNKLTDKLLSGYDVIILISTSGDLFDDEEQGAFERFIQAGKGYVGVHGASASEYDWSWYSGLVGYVFHVHPAVQTAKLIVEDTEFPGMEAMKNVTLWTDEWYEFGDPKSSNLNILLRVDENTYNPEVKWAEKSGDGMGAFHPISWYQEYDNGRSFYTALGHIGEIFRNENYLNHLYGGIYWAATGKK
jgi:type 1 glutamine amidotransferase